MAFPKHQLTKFERAVFVFTGVAKRGNVPKEARLANVLVLWPASCVLEHTIVCPSQTASSKGKRSE